MDLIQSPPRRKSNENHRKLRFSLTLEALPGTDAVNALLAWAAMRQPFHDHLHPNEQELVMNENELEHLRQFASTARGNSGFGANPEDADKVPLCQLESNSYINTHNKRIFFPIFLVLDWVELPDAVRRIKPPPPVLAIESKVEPAPESEPERRNTATVEAEAPARRRRWGRQRHR